MANHMLVTVASSGEDFGDSLNNYWAQQGLTPFYQGLLVGAFIGVGVSSIVPLMAVYKFVALRLRWWLF